MAHIGSVDLKKCLSSTLLGGEEAAVSALVIMFSTATVPPKAFKTREKHSVKARKDYLI